MVNIRKKQYLIAEYSKNPPVINAEISENHRTKLPKIPP